MANLDHKDEELIVGNGGKDSVVTDSVSPKTTVAGQGLSDSPRIGQVELEKEAFHALGDGPIEPFDLLLGLRGETEPIGH
jgi:hypothetical protein